MHLRLPFVVSDIRYEKQEPTLYQARKQNTTAFPSFTLTTDIIEINRFFFSRKDDDCSCSELVDMAKFNWSNFQKGHTELPLGVCLFFFFFVVVWHFQKNRKSTTQYNRDFPEEMSHSIAIVLRSYDSCMIISTNQRLTFSL